MLYFTLVERKTNFGKGRGRLKSHVARGKQKTDVLQLAKRQYERQMKEKAEKQRELEAAHKKKMEVLKVKRQKRQQRRQKLSKRTKRGQPIMANRIDVLLEKIQQV